MLVNILSDEDRVSEAAGARVTVLVWTEIDVEGDELDDVTGVTVVLGSLGRAGCEALIVRTFGGD